MDMDVDTMASICRHIFHYIVDEGITFLCLGDEEFGRRERPGRYQEQVQGHLWRQRKNCPCVWHECWFLSCAPEPNETVLERGERIELLVDRTKNLNQTAFKFKKQSTQLKRHVVEDRQIMLILPFVKAVSMNVHSTLISQLFIVVFVGNCLTLTFWLEPTHNKTQCSLDVYILLYGLPTSPFLGSTWWIIESKWFEKNLKKYKSNMTL